MHSDIYIISLFCGSVKQFAYDFFIFLFTFVYYFQLRRFDPAADYNFVIIRHKPTDLCYTVIVKQGREGQIMLGYAYYTKGKQEYALDFYW